MLKIRLPYVEYEDTTGLACKDPSLTKQSFVEECDFNNVMAKWQNSGLVSHVNQNQAIYADVSEIGDYQSAVELIRSTQEQFMALPSNVRDRFDNDPSKLLAFLQDPNNLNEAVQLGLVEKSVDAIPAVVKPEGPIANVGLSTANAPVGGV